MHTIALAVACWMCASHAGESTLLSLTKYYETCKFQDTKFELTFTHHQESTIIIMNSCHHLPLSVVYGKLLGNNGVTQSKLLPNSLSGAKIFLPGGWDGKGRGMP